MQLIKKTAEQLQRNLGQSFSVEQIENKREVSLYKEGKVSAVCLAENVALLKQSFPELSHGFYNVLEKMLDEEKFSDIKLTHAVKNLIKTCHYPRPTIADILDYDKTAKIKSHDDILVHAKDFSPKARAAYYELHIWNYRLNGYIEKKYKELFPETDFIK